MNDQLVRYWSMAGYVFLTVLISLLVYSAFSFAFPVQAATEPSEEIEDCVPIGKAEGTILYRCIDPEYGTLCYFNPLAAGIIDCVVY